MTDKKQKTGLDLLREAFPANQISKLPKPTRRQTDEVKADFKNGARCADCGGWHHPKVQHLDYVGHAALTDRLLECDPKWNWEPVATTEDGIPKFDMAGGLWIRLTVCDMTRLGYGHADNKKGGDAVKEIIGDAMRNAAMRFGAALDLWHKGDLHKTESDEDDTKGTEVDPFKTTAEEDAEREITKIRTITSTDEFKSYWRVLVEVQPHIANRPDVIAAKDDRKIAIGGKEAA